MDNGKLNKLMLWVSIIAGAITICSQINKIKSSEENTEELI